MQKQSDNDNLNEGKNEHLIRLPSLANTRGTILQYIYIYIYICIYIYIYINVCVYIYIYKDHLDLVIYT